MVASQEHRRGYATPGKTFTQVAGQGGAKNRGHLGRGREIRGEDAAGKNYRLFGIKCIPVAANLLGEEFMSQACSSQKRRQVSAVFDFKGSGGKIDIYNPSDILIQIASPRSLGF